MDDVRQSVFRLVRSGHVGVRNYGWGAFLKALQEQAEGESRLLRLTALAVRVGTHADDRAWREFMGALSREPDRRPAQSAQNLAARVRNR